MAIFRSDFAYNPNLLDFNEPFRSLHTASALSGTTYSFSSQMLPIGSLNYEVGAFDLIVESRLQVTWGVNNEAFLMGNGLTFGTDGAITGGTARMFFLQHDQALNYGFLGIAVAAEDVWAASQTLSNADDKALVVQILSGNDLVALSDFDDVFNSGAGRDLIVDQLGSDRINAGGGNDVVVAGKGNDRVDGSLGNDVVLGGAGNDQIVGGIGRDLIWGGTGSDTLTGGLGVDSFLFKAGDGLAEITDFNAADDQILFMGPNSGLANLTIVKAGNNVRITFSDVTVILLDTLRSEVTVADIAIGGNAALAAAVDAFFVDWTYYV